MIQKMYTAATASYFILIPSRIATLLRMIPLLHNLQVFYNFSRVGHIISNINVIFRNWECIPCT